MIVCFWAETKAGIAELYEDPPNVPAGASITWRTAGSYQGPVGHYCFAPDHPDIEEGYREAKLRVLKKEEDVVDTPVADENPEG